MSADTIDDHFSDEGMNGATQVRDRPGLETDDARNWLHHSLHHGRIDALGHLARVNKSSDGIRSAVIHDLPDVVRLPARVSKKQHGGLGVFRIRQWRTYRGLDHDPDEPGQGLGYLGCKRVGRYQKLRGRAGRWPPLIIQLLIQQRRQSGAGVQRRHDND